jgi:TPR repeat protein
MGLFKLYGQIPPANATKAAEYFRKAAAAGHVHAQTAYAVLALSGTGIRRNVKDAFRWLKRAAEQKDVDAMWLLGTYVSFL